MKIEENYCLQDHNTFRLPAKARWYVEYNTEDELCRLLSDEYFQEFLSLHIGSGSNLLFTSDFNGVVMRSTIGGIGVERESISDVTLRIGAAEIWDNVVAYAVEKGWGGIENLSAIPGETGAAALQNIGAYGVEIKDAIEYVEAYGHFSGEKHVFTAEECEYSYRHSRFKDEHKEPYYITHVGIKLEKNPQLKLEYGAIREQLGEEQPTLASVRNAIMAIRTSKLPCPKELPNAGSFFMNPTVAKEKYMTLAKEYPEIPSYKHDDSGVKLSAAWLIEQCGFKGKRHGDVGVYAGHALIIVNHGEASGHEIALLAESIRVAVDEKFGVELMPEVKYV